jgi:hypothetical protein
MVEVARWDDDVAIRMRITVNTHTVDNKQTLLCVLSDVNLIRDFC